MSQEETLRLVATVSDKFSGPIAAMRKSLEGLTQRNVASHKAGRQAALAHEKAFVDLRKAVKETGEHVKGILEPAFVGLGIGAISTGAAIAGVTAAIKGFADSSRSLEFARKETGLTIQTLREYEALAPTIGSTAEAMDQGFRKLAGNLDQWRHRLGPLREFFASRFGEGAGYIRQLGEALVHTTDNAKALSKINALAAMMPKESERRAFYEALGLDPNLARLKGRELTDALAGIRSRLKPYGPDDIVKGRATAEAFDRIRESISSLKDTIGADLAPAMTQATDAVRTFIEAHGEDLRKLFADVAVAIRDAPWKEWGNDVRDAAGKIDGVAQSIGGWKVALEGLIAVNVLAWLAPIAGILGPMGLAITGAVAGLVAVGAKIKELNDLNAGPSSATKDVFDRMRHAQSAAKVFDRMRHGGAGGEAGGTGFNAEEKIQKGTQAGSKEGTRQGVLDAFRAWIQERGQGGIIQTAYHPGASGGIGGGGGGRAGGGGGSAGGGGATAPFRQGKGEDPEVVAFLRAEAIKNHVNPDYVLAVARSEGLKGFSPSKGTWSAGPNDRGTSWGALQAHFKNNIPGLSAAGQGDAMLREGINARDMSQWKKVLAWQVS
jgi:hypothetical protein